MTAYSNSRPAAAAWRPYQIYLLAVLVLVTMSSYLDRQVMALLQESIKRDLRLSDWQIGLLSGPAFALFHSFVGLPTARVAERANRPRVLSVAVVVWSTMTALCALAGNFAMLGLCRIGVGMGEGGCNPISHSLTADSFSVRQRGVAMAVLSAGSPIAAVIAPLVAGFGALRWGWRATFLVVGLPGLIMAVLAWFTLRETRAPRTADSPPLRSFATDMAWLAGNRAFVFIFVAGAFNGIGIQGIGIFTASYVMRMHGMNIAQAGEVLSLRGLMGLAATVVGGFLADRFADARGRVYVLGPAIGATLSVVLFFAGFTISQWTVAIGLILLGAFASELKNGPNFAAVQNIVPSHMRATAAALFFLAATVVGTGLGAAIVGGVSDMAAAQQFPAELGHYAALCPGGRALASAPRAVASACAEASSGGLRAALSAISFAFLGAAAFFYLSSRTIEVNND